jgi:hypothetical protein
MEVLLLTGQCQGPEPPVGRCERAAGRAFSARPCHWQLNIVANQKCSAFKFTTLLQAGRSLLGCAHTFPGSGRLTCQSRALGPLLHAPELSISSQSLPLTGRLHWAHAACRILPL